MPNNDGKTIPIVIPLYNEIQIAELLKDAITTYCEKTRNQVFILVCDHCTDGTFEYFSKKFLNNAQVCVIENANPKGYGSAVRFGFSHADSLDHEWAITVDSDLTNPLSEALKVIKWITSADEEKLLNTVIVKGNRFSRIIPSFHDVPFQRVLLSTAANLVAKILTVGASNDPTNGFRAVRLSWYRLQTFQENSFAAIMEEFFFAKRDRKSIEDIVTELRYDQALRDKSSFTFNVQTMAGYLKYSLLTLKSKMSN